MFEDPIIKDIRRVRHAHALQFNNDLATVVADLCRLQRESGRSYVNFPPRLREKPSAERGRQAPPTSS